jgi:ectoine hydroxylase-related dioxygenase (phytanoyl-CoA dioxygenase family)
MMTPAPIRSVTSDEREFFKQHGVVQLKGILPIDWVDQLRAAMEDIYETHLKTEDNPVERRAAAVLAEGGKILSDLEKPTGRFFIRNSPSRVSPELKRFAFESPMKLIAADLFDAGKLNFYFDQLFWKEAGSGTRTTFHQDVSYFNCTGEQCGTFWVAVDSVTKANGAMGYVKGSHLWGKEYAVHGFVNRDPLAGSVGEQVPDIENNEADYDLVYYDSEPGDVLVHDYRTLHGSTGNISGDKVRRSFAVRFTGDDVRYYNRPGAPVQAPSSDKLRDGDILDSEEFPVVWRRS